MKSLKHFSRLMVIGFILLKHGLDEFLFDITFFRPFRFLRWLSPARWRQKRSKGERLRRALEELGPIFVKFGQLLSTRVDSIPEDIANELVLLQDRVPPFSQATAKAILEQAFDVNAVFKHVDTTPLASASIAQVHPATLITGETVVVKMVRPTIHKTIKKDIDILKTLAQFAQRYSRHAKRFKPWEVVLEFEKILHDELDLLREAANASQLRRNFQNSDLLYVPKIYWQFAKKNILVIERIYGVPVSNKAQLIEKGINVEKLAERMILLFFTQVFRDCFFHADMHPGNLLVDPNSTTLPKCIAVDFGIMGVLSAQDQHYLAENFMAFLKRDYRRVAELHVESGWVPQKTRLDEFESAIRTVCEPIFERPLSEISFGQLLLQLFQTASRHHVNIQPQLILLQKTLITVEGLARQLHPTIDLWETTKPLLETWMKSQVGVSAFVRKLKTHRPYWLEKLPELPQLLYASLVKITEEHYDTPTVKSEKTLLNKDSVVGLSFGILLSITVWLLYRSFL